MCIKWIKRNERFIKIEHHILLLAGHKMYEKFYEDVIEKAKVRIIAKLCGKSRAITPYQKKKYKELFDDNKTRKWIECHADSYEENDNRISFIVCEGSPVKGFIIVNYGSHTVTVVDAWGNKLYTWTNLYHKKDFQ